MAETEKPGRMPVHQSLPSSIRHILFDLDGTLVDSVRITCAIIDAMLAERGAMHRADPALARAMDAIGGAAMISAVMGPACSDPDRDIAEFRARHVTAPTPQDLAFAGIPALLAALSAKGMQLAICSNKPQPLCEKILLDLQLDRYFQCILGATGERPRKPAPDIAVLAMARLGAKADTCLFVGDSPVDVATAHAAGLPIALAAWGYGIAAARVADPSAWLLTAPGDLLA